MSDGYKSPTAKVLREALLRHLAIYDGDPDQELLNRLLTELAAREDMLFSDLFRKRTNSSTRPTSRPVVKASANQDWLNLLQIAFSDDKSFNALVDELNSARTPNREALNMLYNALFSANRELSTKMTRKSIIQDIADNRNSIVRSQKAAKLLSGVSRGN